MSGHGTKLPAAEAKKASFIASWPSFALCMRGLCDQQEARRSRGTHAGCKPGQVTIITVQERDVEADYTVGAVLGKGGFGVVREGIHRVKKGKVALKFVNRAALSERDERLVLDEAAIMNGLRHGNVVEMLGFYRWDKAYCLALEHMAGGELLDDILRRVFYSEACARRIVLQILDALSYLHRRGIVHRDVKPENLLLPRAGGDQIKIADFGLATVLSPPTYKAVQPVGSPGYAAPELLKMLPYDGQVDMFSLGVIAFVLLAGYLPFGGAAGSNIDEVLQATVKGVIKFDRVQWSATTEDARDFVTKLLDTNPSTRLTAEGALFHPWMLTNGSRLLKRPLSDRRSGISKGLLEKFQTDRKQKLKAAVGVVMATNRLQQLTASGANAAAHGGLHNHQGDGERDRLMSIPESMLNVAAPTP